MPGVVVLLVMVGSPAKVIKYLDKNRFAVSLSTV